MLFIGDVHGKVKEYLKLIENEECSIQCGDMGIGFVKIPKVEGNHKWIRGNHDNPNMAAKHPNNIKDGTFFEEESIFCVGGAWSIDWEDRIIGVSWWPNEEVGVNKFQKIIDYYTICKPEIMVTHDCPTIMAEQINSHHKWDKSKTRQALDVMFETWKPDVWIAGHHHISMKTTISGTEFIMLNELESINLDI